MFKFKKSIAGAVNEEFECECCGTLDGKAQKGCGCGSEPVTSYANCECSGSSPVKAESSIASGCNCSCSPNK